MRYRNWRQILAIGLGIAMMSSQTAYANVTMISETLSVGESDGQATAIRAEAPTVSISNGQESETQETAAEDRTSVITVGQAQESAGASEAQEPAGTSEPTSMQEQTAEPVTVAVPEIASEGAVLINAATGQVLFGKNEDQQFYPASITKVMTALLTLEHCNLNDVVTFSASATTNLESGAVALGVSEGDQLTVEQCLYGLLLKSANEIGNGLAEHIAGSVSGFADMMNEKARALGCKNTHFVNPHGLNNAEHKTTPYDMALILRAALENETFRKIDTTTSYRFPAIKNAQERTITMGHKMLYASDERYYEGIIGGKTGYTSKAGNTLVTGAERNGVRLIAVVMKSKGTHYADTKALLDYGFAYLAGND